MAEFFWRNLHRSLAEHVIGDISLLRCSSVFPKILYERVLDEITKGTPLFGGAPFCQPDNFFFYYGANLSFHSCPKSPLAPLSKIFQRGEIVIVPAISPFEKGD